MKLKPSVQQENILDWVENGKASAIIEAVAGSGKTTTLLMCLEKTKGNVAFMAYNRAVAEEIGNKVKNLNLGKRVTTGTVHKFGSDALKITYPKAKPPSKDPNKANLKLETIYDKLIGDKFYRFFACKAVSMAKQTGIGAICPIDDAHEWSKMIDHYSLTEYLPKWGEYSKGLSYAQELLIVSNKNLNNVFDFNDMVYAPVLNNLKMQQYDWVFIDEAQDINPVRLKLAKKMLAQDGRLVAVGDRHQAIYGFTGAHSQSMEMIKEEFDCIELPLTVSYRCPNKVVKEANRWVAHIRARDDAPDGIVDTHYLQSLIENDGFSQNDVILCRKTKPLVELAFKLIQNGIPCKIEGRDIGRELSNLSKKWKVSSVQELKGRIHKWKGREIEKAVSKGNYNKCGLIEDKAETLMVIIDQCGPNDTILSLTEKINFFFKDSIDFNGSILTLSTIHRAKGKEWDRVFALDMDKHSPSKWAKLDWEKEQEVNLCYVMVTRAKNHLTFLQSYPSRG